MAHGSSTCSRCKGLLVRDMYGVWYHDGSQEGIEKYNDDDHAPEPQQADLIAIRRAEQRSAAAGERMRIRAAVEGLPILGYEVDVRDVLAIIDEP